VAVETQNIEQNKNFDKNIHKMAAATTHPTTTMA
jgi:hypothetical protein